MQQRHPRQHQRIEPVVLGVLGVVAAQVRRLLGGDQHHGGAERHEVSGDDHPRVAGRFHHDRQLLGRSGSSGHRDQFVATVVEPSPSPHHLPSIIGQGGDMRRAHRQVDPHRRQCFSSESLDETIDPQRTDPSARSRTSELTGIRSHRSRIPQQGHHAQPSRPPRPPFRHQKSARSRSSAEIRRDETDQPDHPTKPPIRTMRPT